MNDNKLLEIQQATIMCRQCPRLVDWRERVAVQKVRRFRDQEYWGKPLAGFGDPHAPVVIIGLAPAAHGGNRTGRMFTGDDSASWLINALHETGFANQNTSEHKDDGLVLSHVYITAAVRCAPPQNKPTRQEAANCFHFLVEELDVLKPRIVIVLGRFAFEAFRRYLNNRGINTRGLSFAHGKQETWTINSHRLTLLMSYHPSRQNTQTKKLTHDMFLEIFQRAQSILHDEARCF